MTSSVCVWRSWAAGRSGDFAVAPHSAATPTAATEPLVTSWPRSRDVAVRSATPVCLSLGGHDSAEWGRPTSAEAVQCSARAEPQAAFVLRPLCTQRTDAATVTVTAPRTTPLSLRACQQPSTAAATSRIPAHATVTQRRATWSGRGGRKPPGSQSPRLSNGSVRVRKQQQQHEQQRWIIDATTDMPPGCGRSGAERACEWIEISLLAGPELNSFRLLYASMPC